MKYVLIKIDKGFTGVIGEYQSDNISEAINHFKKRHNIPLDSKGYFKNEFTFIVAEEHFSN